MNYPNTEFLKRQLTKDQDPRASFTAFEINAEDYQRHLAELRKTSNETAAVQSDRAVYRCLTWERKKPNATTHGAIPVPVITLTEFHAVARQHRKIQIIGFSVLAVLEILHLLFRS